MDLSAHIPGMLAWLSEGNTELSYCKYNNIPHWKWRALIGSSPKLFDAILKARAQGSWSEVDEAQRIAGDVLIDPQQARNMIDIRKWRASKFMPKIFGEKLDISVAERIDLIGVIEARKRGQLQPSGNLVALSEPQDVDYTELLPTRLTDTIPVIAPGDEEQSVFD